MIDIEVEGLDELLRAFQDAPGIIRDEAEDAADTWLGDVVRELAKYPPPPAGSKYVRTGTLGRGWLSADSRWQGDTRTLTNPTPYAQWVQSDERQAWMHQGRWQTAGQVMARMQGQLDKLLDRASQRTVDQIIRRAGR